MKRDEKGNYYWVGTFDKEYETKQYKIVFYALGGMCLFLMILIGSLCIPNGDWSLFLMGCVLPCGIIMAITLGVIAVFKRGPGSTRGYGMSETGIWIGSGRSRGDFYFRSAKHVVFTKTYIDPMMKIGGFRIYVPEEDMPFVKNFVRRHLPETCLIEDKSYNI